MCPSSMRQCWSWATPGPRVPRASGGAGSVCPRGTAPVVLLRNQLQGRQLLAAGCWGSEREQNAAVNVGNRKKNTGILTSSIEVKKQADQLSELSTLSKKWTPAKMPTSLRSQNPTHWGGAEGREHPPVASLTSPPMMLSPARELTISQRRHPRR